MISYAPGMRIIVRGEEIVVLISDDWNIQDVTIYPFNRFYTDEIKELNIRVVKKEKQYESKSGR